jgi:phosphatidylglycerophosphate synthase/putative flippase GtrA
VLEVLWHWILGDLSPEARVFTAVLPVALVLAYALLGLGVYAVRNARRGEYHDDELERRGATPILGMWIRRYFSWLMAPLEAALLRLRLPPNAVTTLSLLLAVAAAVAVAAGRFSLGGWLFVASGLCDFLDGRLARESKQDGPAGALLDSVLDRYVEAVIYIGLAWYYRESWVLVAVLLALTGSLLVPYVRARGEALGVSFSNVGLAQRPERVVILGVSLALSPIFEVLLDATNPHPLHRLAVVAVVLLAAATHVSALQRLSFAHRSLSASSRRARAMLGRGSLFRNAIAGGVATGADFLVVALLVERSHLSPAFATLVGCGVGAVVNFAINRVWTFGSDAPKLAQAGRYVFVSASSAGLNSGLVWVLLLLPAMPYQLAWILVRGAVYVTWNFPLHRDYVFPSGSPDAHSGA